MDPTKAKCKDSTRRPLLHQLKISIIFFFFPLLPNKLLANAYGVAHCQIHHPWLFSLWRLQLWRLFVSMGFKKFVDKWLTLQRCAISKALKYSKVWQTWQAMRSQTDWPAAENPFKPLGHMVWITQFKVVKARKKDHIFMNAAIINPMKTHHKISLPSAKFADTVIMSPLTLTTQFKQHSWLVKITTTNSSWH